jgi:hypothetical protein
MAKQPKTKSETTSPKSERSAQKGSTDPSTTGDPTQTVPLWSRPSIPADDPIYKAGFGIGERRSKPLSKGTPADLALGELIEECWVALRAEEIAGEEFDSKKEPEKHW